MTSDSRSIDKGLATGRDDDSWIGNTARAAMLALGLGLSGLGVFDAVVPKKTTVEYGAPVVTDNVEGSPEGYIFFGSTFVAGSRFRRGKKAAASRDGNER